MADRGAGEPLDDLFRGLYAWFFRNARKDIGPEDVLNAARRVAEDLLRQCSDPVTWESAKFVTIRELRRPGMLYRPVRVTVTIAQFMEPKLVALADGEQEHTIGTRLVLEDVHGRKIETLDVVGEAIVDQLEDLSERGRLVEVLGRVLAVPEQMGGADKKFVLQLLDARATNSAMDMLAATGSERASTQELLTRLAEEHQPPLEFLLKQLVEGLHVAAVDEFPLLLQLLRFTVLQALSVERLNHASGRLHAIVVGPPAQGKKLIGLAARALNPRCNEASPSKITPAGLIGASYPAEGGWRSQPGLIPKSDGGVVVLQDAHAVSANELRRLGPVLQQLIEDGVLRDSVAGGARREVSVGLLIDLNRFGQLTAASSNGKSAEAAILGLRPLLSRVDLLAEIPGDPARAWRVAEQMYRTLGQGESAFDAAPWVRTVRLLVAALRDANPSVDLSSVRDLMARIHAAIAVENEPLFRVLPELGDLPTRLVITFGRLVCASARAHGRAIAVPADVDEALQFIRIKLEFLRALVPRLVEATTTEKAGEEHGYEKARQRHAGKIVHPADFAAAYEEATVNPRRPPWQRRPTPGKVRHFAMFRGAPRIAEGA